MKYYERILTDVGNRPITQSYRKMAKKTGLNYSYLQKVLTGKIIPEKKKFYKIMDVLKKFNF